MTQEYNWKLYPEAATYLEQTIKNFEKKNPYTKKFSQILHEKTSTHLEHWIDHITIPKTKLHKNKLHRMGYTKTKDKTEHSMTPYKNPNSVHPAILLTPDSEHEITLKTEEIENTLQKLHTTEHIRGNKNAPIRIATLNTHENHHLKIIERRGSNDYTPIKTRDTHAYQQALKKYKARKRNYKTNETGITNTKKLIETTQKKLTKARSADAFMRAEREYWQKRNKAGQHQKARQDTVGLGWGNHDHHTYRSSRQNFKELLTILTKLGFTKRERFYAGAKAGWGAQVLDHPNNDIVIFADVDITHNENKKDFTKTQLENTNILGTVGLWCGIHGESILEAGMHHLEARYDHNKLTRDLAKQNIGMMPPFSNLPFLKQAFTQGQNWQVNKTRVHKLLTNNQITQKEYQKLLEEGAIGSHLENLQRKQGYKGFNQRNITAIIKATNPLKRFTKETHKAA